MCDKWYQKVWALSLHCVLLFIDLVAYFHMSFRITWTNISMEIQWLMTCGMLLNRQAFNYWMGYRLLNKLSFEPIELIRTRHVKQNSWIPRSSVKRSRFPRGTFIYLFIYLLFHLRTTKHCWGYLQYKIVKTYKRQLGF